MPAHLLGISTNQSKDVLVSFMHGVDRTGDGHKMTDLCRHARNHRTVLMSILGGGLGSQAEREFYKMPRNRRNI